MPTDALHLVINGRCSWCQGPHKTTPLSLTIDDFHQTRHAQTTQHMHWPVDADTTRRLAKVIRQPTHQPQRTVVVAPGNRWLRW